MALEADRPSARSDLEGAPMESGKLNQVLEQLAALGQRPSEKVLLGLAAASGRTYEEVLEIYNWLE